MSARVHIHWFRQDLRLADNPALTEAARDGRVLPVFILDDVNAGEFARGGASRWWLHHALEALDASLGGRLRVFAGDPLRILPELARASGAAGVFWNRCWEPWRIARDTRLKAELRDAGLTVRSHNGSLLWEPDDVLKSDGTPYKVFTPFFRRGCLTAEPPRRPLPAPPALDLAPRPADALRVADLGLLPRSRGGEPQDAHWRIGEAGAHQRLREFLARGLRGYRQGRDFPARPHVSRLSPSLHFGEVSPHQAWHAAQEAGEGDDLFHFQSELAWREFSYSLLYHNPELPRENLQRKFDDFPWLDDPDTARRWRRGQTGYPIVDAGMRELWATGYMHNRVRMIVGSFLVKNLLLHWRHGERWFWDCLADADLANNSAGWQWVAGCGADAAPYFRVFNPVTQGHKFDPDGAYTRRWAPELARLPQKHLFSPWEAPAHVLREAGVTLGATYPEPAVELKPSRERALAAFQSLKRS